MTDPNPPPDDQLLLFAAVAAASPAVKQGRPAIQQQRSPDQLRRCPKKGDGEGSVHLELPWDFRESFPEPMIEAFVHGTLHPDDADLENVKAIHLEHAAEAHAMLDELDALETARQHGVDPVTGKPPRTEKKREELAELFANEPGRIQRGFDEQLAAYADAFGLTAADAFAPPSACSRERL